MKILNTFSLTPVKPSMKAGLALPLVFLCLATTLHAETVSVPARANIWLAGATNGTTARRGDSAPDESPVLVIATPIQAGATYTFSASGSANHGPTLPYVGPEGEDLISHYLGAENGIADLTAPFVSLVGVFLGPNPPNQTPAPPSLDFRNETDRDYLALAPALKQPFFLGKGLTSSGAVQQVIAPAGATRLFLGVMDEYAFYDNEGSFEVKVAKETSRPPTKLVLHPSLNPSTADAVANTTRAISLPTRTLRVPGTAATTNLPTAPGPQLHAYTAIELSWPSEPGRLYQLQWTTSLATPQWANLGPLVTGTGDNLSLFDSTRTHPQGFYRVRTVR